MIFRTNQTHLKYVAPGNALQDIYAHDKIFANLYFSCGNRYQFIGSVNVSIAGSGFTSAMVTGINAGKPGLIQTALEGIDYKIFETYKEQLIIPVHDQVDLANVNLSNLAYFVRNDQVRLSDLFDHEYVVSGGILEREKSKLSIASELETIYHSKFSLTNPLPEIEHLMATNSYEIHAYFMDREKISGYLSGINYTLKVGSSKNEVIHFQGQHSYPPSLYEPVVRQYASYTFDIETDMNNLILRDKKTGSVYVSETFTDFALVPYGDDTETMHSFLIDLLSNEKWDSLGLPPKDEMFYHWVYRRSGKRIIPDHWTMIGLNYRYDSVSPYVHSIKN